MKVSQPKEPMTRSFTAATGAMVTVASLLKSVSDVPCSVMRVRYRSVTSLVSVPTRSTTSSPNGYRAASKPASSIEIASSSTSTPLMPTPGVTLRPVRSCAPPSGS